MKLSEITPLILTYNEEPNITRCLDQLKWAQRVIVIDSGSKDGTLVLCRKYDNVVVIHRVFDSHTEQWNFGIKNTSTNWVLSLDADYIIPSCFDEDVAGLNSDDPVAYYARFRYVLKNRILRGSLYPNRAVLFSKSNCHYVNDGHTQLLQIDGTTGELNHNFLHDDRKPLSRWLDSQRKYASLEADKMSKEKIVSGLPDRIRRMIWPAAPAAFLYTLFGKRLIFDGWPGLFYVLQRTYAELLLSLEILDRRMNDKSIDS